MRTALIAPALVAALAMPLIAGAAEKPLQIHLSQTKDSGETGTATFLQGDGQVIVKLRMSPASTDPQPAHVHKGKSCETFDPKPTYPLANVVEGQSETKLKGVTLAQLQSGDYVVNVHKSTKDVGTYVACGAIPTAKK